MFANIFTTAGTGLIAQISDGIEDAWLGDLPLLIALVGVGWGMHLLRKFGAIKRA